MENYIDVLKEAKIDGNYVKLPDVKLDRKLYMEVAKHLELIGGKWKGGKTQAFEFKTDPTSLLEKLTEGDKVNLKKEFQFFATPADLAKEMIYYAELYNGLTVLEPSAGQGAIINAIHALQPSLTVDYCELMDVNRMILEKISNVRFMCDDFLELPEDGNFQYDRIIANPPFNKNQDIDHIKKMYNHLKEGGILVTLCSKHYIQSKNKKETSFNNWLIKLDALINVIPSGTFKKSGTNVETILIVIKKK